METASPFGFINDNNPGTETHILDPKCQELMLPSRLVCTSAEPGKDAQIELRWGSWKCWSSPSRTGLMRWLLRYYGDEQTHTSSQSKARLLNPQLHLSSKITPLFDTRGTTEPNVHFSLQFPYLTLKLLPPNPSSIPALQTTLTRLQMKPALSVGKKKVCEIFAGKVRRRERKRDQAASVKVIETAQFRVFLQNKRIISGLSRTSGIKL